jgi:hypothetical protein
MKNFAETETVNKISSRGRCYDHDFLRFSPIFRQKLAIFLKNNVYFKIITPFPGLFVAIFVLLALMNLPRRQVTSDMKTWTAFADLAKKNCAKLSDRISFWARIKNINIVLAPNRDMTMLVDV